MDAFSSHLCFQVLGNPIIEKDLWNKIQTIPCSIIESQMTPILVNFPNGDKMLIATGNDGSHCVMHVYSHGLVTIDIQYDVTSDEDKINLSRNSFSKNKGIESEIKALLGKKCQFTRSVPSVIKRGRLCPYFQRGDDSLYELKQPLLLAEINSPWQNIKIYKTEDCGNMLCLDDDINIEVINACRKHLRKVCGDALDNLVGCNYNIRIENCVNVLKELAEENQKFDYVINDLSEYLIDTEKGHDNDFTTAAKILEFSMKVLNVGGKYLSRGDCEGNVAAIKSFTKDVKENGLNFKTFRIDVPSYKEKYCLFEVWRPEQNGFF